ncbi:MAG: PAS domain S-box protein [Candidatus Nealsonbacteria bacterium]|nr:PAS domain S-box protein [Candidatus Nealsonbacteria bacterium]
MKISKNKKKKTKQFSEENFGRKAKEKVFGESEEKLKSIFDNTNDAIIFLDKFGKILDINKKAAEIFGGSEKELVGKHFTKTGLFPIKELPTLIRNFKNILTAKKIYINVSFKNKKDQQIDLECSASLIKINEVTIIMVIARDFTEHKRLDEMLREREKRLRTILDSVLIGIVIIDAETHKIMEINPIATKMIGAPKEKIVGSICHKYICPAEKGKCPITDLGQSVNNSERVLFKADGKSIPILKTVTSFILEDRKCLLESFVDITERKQTETALQESDERYKSLFEHSLNCVYLSDFRGNFIDANQSALNLLGYTRDEITSLNFASMLSLDQQSIAFKTNQEVIATGTQKKPTEFRLRCKDGGYVNVVTTASLVYQKGKPYAVQGIATDITERRQTEVVLREEKNKFEKYFDATGAIIIFLSLDGKVLLINKIGYETLEYNKDDILNKNWIDKFVFEKDRIKTTAIFDSIIREKTDEIKYFETTLLTKNRKNTTVNWGIVLIKGESGESQAILNIGINITELAEAKIAIDQLKELNKLKDDFLNISAHELRTPLTSIIGFSDILKEQSHSLNSKQQKYINIINAESLMLNNIIKRILTITRFESGREIIHFEPINLTAFIQSLQPSLDMLLKNKKAKLVINTEKKDIVVKSNKEKILEVIYNFVDNSLKYGSEEQTITISLTQPEKERVKIAVKDRGTGIPPEKIDKLFNKFSQLEPSLVRSQEGTGLGLYICKLIVDSLGGKIGVESTLGKGSSFFFTLPIENVATQKRDLDLKAV